MQQIHENGQAKIRYLKTCADFNLQDAVRGIGYEIFLSLTR